VIHVVLLCGGAGAGLMLALWWRQLRTANATSVDVAWSFLIASFALVYGATAEGDLPRRALVSGLAAAWALRLGTHLLTDRVLPGHPEDGRYRALRQHWGAAAPRGFLGLYLAQAAVALLFSLPILAAAQGGPLDGWAAAGVAVWIVAVAGETLADRQLAAFRADPRSRGQVCRAGLWRWSRHPNYFFEWLHWFAYVLIGHNALLTWIGPPLMLLFLFRVSGIPWTEAQALRSRGEEYRRYQRTTSVFLPWPPRGEVTP
jgi:steroid 5-alpha reductase family enzyme